MLNYLERLSVPEWLVLIVIGLAVIAEVAGWLSKIWDVIAPKVFKISTASSRKKEIEKIIISNQNEIRLLKEKHCNDMEKSEETDSELKDEINKTNEKLDKISDLVLDMRIENMRKTLLDFASGVGDSSKNRKYTKEQFDEMFLLHKDYEELLEEHHMTNGRVDISMEIIREKYKYNVLHGGFLEDELNK